MRKKAEAILCFGLIMIMVTLTACTKKQEEKNLQEPGISQIRSICELATMECYYHNVVKGKVEGGWFKDGWNDGWNILDWMRKANVEDCEYWFEYVGVIKIGIDMANLKIQVKEDKVEITIPKAKILSSEVKPESLDDGLYVTSTSDNDGAWITLEHETEAIAIAQENMNKEARENTMVFEEATERAKKLIQNYIVQMGKLTDKEYTIQWIEAETLDEEIAPTKESAE